MYILASTQTDDRDSSIVTCVCCFGQFSRMTVVVLQAASAEFSCSTQKATCENRNSENLSRCKKEKANKAEKMKLKNIMKR